MQHVLVVGSGNAALSAALSALQSGARVTVVEAGSESDFGGNSRYTAGAMRFAYSNRADVLELLADLDDPRVAKSDFGRYPPEVFASDLRSFSNDQPLTRLQKLLVDESQGTMRWLSESGVEFEPIYARQAFEKDGQFHFWGGLTLASKGEGEGLVFAERRLVEALGCELILDSPVTELLVDDRGVHGVRCPSGSFEADAVVVACGGFEASPEARAEHLGPDWRRAKVRGTALNTGAGIRMATDVGADLAGNFDACHAVCMDVSTPDFRQSSIPHIERKNFRKISYPFGILLNKDGVRFVDEGADFRNYTYAQYGRAVLAQPDGVAWQIFDGQVEHLLYEEYRQDHATRYVADTLGDLVGQLPGINRPQALETLARFNGSTSVGGFDPTVKDGCSTRGLELPKSNWALPLERPPFTAYEVTCGITFTYGGLSVDTSGAVLDRAGSPITGLFAAGEVVGGIFFDGYPGGSGLTAGAVMGRRAGRSAAQVTGRQI